MGRSLNDYKRIPDKDFFYEPYRVALPDDLLPEELKERGGITGEIEGADYIFAVWNDAKTRIAHNPIYCSKCNTVIPASMIQSTTRCPFCHKEF